MRLESRLSGLRLANTHAVTSIVAIGNHRHGPESSSAHACFDLSMCSQSTHRVLPVRLQLSVFCIGLRCQMHAPSHLVSLSHSALSLSGRCPLADPWHSESYGRPCDGLSLVAYRTGAASPCIGEKHGRLSPSTSVHDMDRPGDPNRRPSAALLHPPVHSATHPVLRVSVLAFEAVDAWCRTGRLLGHKETSRVGRFGRWNETTHQLQQ